MAPKREHLLTEIKDKGLWVVPGLSNWHDTPFEVNWIAQITPRAGSSDKVERKFWPRPRMKSPDSKKMVPDTTGKKPLVFLPSEVMESERWYPIEIGNDTQNGTQRTRRRGYFAARVLGGWLLTVTGTCPWDVMSLVQRLNAGEVIDGVPETKGVEKFAQQMRDDDDDDRTEPANVTGEGDEMDTSDILGMLTGLEQAVCEEDWGGAEYLSEQVMRAVGTRKRAAAVKTRREQLEREKEWASAHPGAGTP